MEKNKPIYTENQEYDRETKSTQSHVKEMTMTETVKINYVPRQSGVYTAYRPEYKDSSGNWQNMTVKYSNSSKGIPGLRNDNGAINIVIFLFGYEQAWALAWAWLATEVARGENVTEGDIRVQPYEVDYVIKAHKQPVGEE